MLNLPRVLFHRCSLLAFLFWATAAQPAADISSPVPRVKGPIFNQDSTQFFFDYTATEMSGALVDAYIDQLADAGIRTFVSCVNAQRANYPSKVWEHDWDRYDPAGPNDQPVLRYLAAAGPAGIAATRGRLDAAKRLADLGINFHARALARCRARGIGAWVSVRMNDLHDCLLPESTLLSSFFKAQRAAGQLRAPYRGGDWWADRGLDWERPEVQDHYFTLVREQLETLDLDGLELDWMRFPLSFRPGHELAGGRAITAWMQRVRAECARAATRLGHPVLLGVRVPTRPEAARRLGLDGAGWARVGLVDLVVPTPFWSTTDFDIPIQEWKRLLAGTSAELAGGIEIRYQPVPNGPASMMTPALVAGVSAALLHGGADAVYLFNYIPKPLFQETQHPWTAAEYSAVMHGLQSAAGAAALARVHAITYRDIRAPGEPADAAFPATDHHTDFQWPPGCALRVQTGPVPEAGRAVALTMEFGPDSAGPDKLRVYLNATELAPAAGSQGALRTYPIPHSLLQDEAQVVEIVSGKDAAFTVQRLEISVAKK
ncbi:hypothetical protein K0B96_12635 [Horticoccus luteus]|uniref:Glycosyl hydrolase-like 10 domain-containing protein n=1 Tax=Horticoccus luteus TaxID=2862869 RepID=A0A8F9TSD2_9BACT|nr:hypothetical protein [Horticoccus luteus]QYM78151.1 hypothetical protein K0B96_12635 [Horticoccus luteus]